MMIVLSGFLLLGRVQGQSEQDISLIKTHNREKSSGHNNHNHQISFLLSDHPGFFVRYNPLTLAMGSIMWTYQKIISPQFSSTCLYSPSCSAYSKDLIYDFGILRGIVFTADRLTRCNRIALIDFKSWEIEPGSGKIKERTSYYRLND